MQRRTLVRTRGLPAFRRTLVDLALQGPPLNARSRIVIVPTRAAGELLRQAIEAQLDAPADSTPLVRPSTLILPDLLTRDEWLTRLHTALPAAPSLLSRIEREVLFESAARRVAGRAASAGAPFHLRPGLVAAMLGLYDELRRRQRTVRRFARVLFDQLRVERGTDRGSESLIRQTTFLGLAFLAYQRAAAASGGLDEHRLRDLLLAQQPVLPFDHVVIAVADHPTDPRGLWPADFDLLGRLEGVRRLDVVMTEESHDAGFRERLEQELPGIVESFSDSPASQGTLIRPSEQAEGPACFVSRDREEELRDVARAVIDRGRRTGGALAEATAVVFHRPLPYRYLAQQTLGDARVPYQAFDALPLAAEPYAALLDLVLTAARTDGARDAIVGLLRSALIAVEVGGARVGRRDVADLDTVLQKRRATSTAAGFEAEVTGFFGQATSRRGIDLRRARRAARAAAMLAAELTAFRDGSSSSEQVGTIAAFLRRRESDPADGAAWVERHRRARAAVLGALDGLALAYRRHDDRPREPEAIGAAILHAIEARTFAPRTGQAGVHLVDAVAARFGAFDHVHLVGLVETDWPERPRRSVFYTSGLLKALSWPQETDQMKAQRAAFRDLLGLAARTTTLHAFKLEGDSVVAPSPILDSVADLPATHRPDDGPSLIFDDEVLTSGGIPIGLDVSVEAWLVLRRMRPRLDDPRYSGEVEPQPPQAYRVSRVDRYADCPFKYFAASVLRLPEEQDEAAGLTALERGTLLHELFERFYREWHADGMRAITMSSLPDALGRFTRLTRERLSHLPAADRVLEDARLLGSLVGRGVAERVFELEADTDRAVIDRYVEVDLNGEFTFPLPAGRQAMITVRGKADRVDVFDDGSIGVVDYKLGRAPKPQSVQVAVYAHCARTALAEPSGPARRVESAMYLAFGEDGRLDGPVGKPGEVAAAVEDRARQFAAHVEQIEAGRFPARPQQVGDCVWCPYGGVCRKEYKVEDHDTSDPV